MDCCATSAPDSTQEFSGDDELVALLAIGGTTLSAIATDVQYGEERESWSRKCAAGSGCPAQNSGRVATAVLRCLGVPAAEARASRDVRWANSTPYGSQPPECHALLSRLISVTKISGTTHPR